jgi:hypothetical protein
MANGGWRNKWKHDEHVYVESVFLDKVNLFCILSPIYKHVNTYTYIYTHKHISIFQFSLTLPPNFYLSFPAYTPDDANQDGCILRFSTDTRSNRAAGPRFLRFRCPRGRKMVEKMRRRRRRRRSDSRSQQT